MIIKTSYNSLVNLLTLMNLVTSSKTLQEDYKVLNLFVKDEKLHALSTDCQLFCLDTLEGTYDLEGESNPFMVIRIKETMDILSKFASLQRTQVKEVILSTQQKGIVMTVVEEPKVLKDDANFKFSDMYKNQVSRFKLVRYEAKAFVMNELPTIVLPTGSVEISSKELQKYMDYFYTPMSKPKDLVWMNFDEEFVWSIMGNIYGISMANTLPKDIFTEISLSLHYMNFLKNVLPSVDTFKIYKDVSIKKMPQAGVPEENWKEVKTIILYLQVGNILIKLSTIDNTKSVSTATFKHIGQNSVEVDKPYLIDTLKRIEGFDQVYVEITIKEDDLVSGSSNAEFIIKTQRTIQHVPVKFANGSGEFKFVLRPDNLGSMVFSHVTKDMDGNTDKVNDLIFYLDIFERGFVDLTCRDRTDGWQTRYPRVPQKEAPQLDF